MRSSKSVILIVLSITCVFVEVCTSIITRDNFNEQFIGCCLQVIHLWIASHNAASLDIIWYFIIRIILAECLTTIEQTITTNIIPTTFGQPCLVKSTTVTITCRYDGRHQDVIAEHIFTLLSIGLVFLGPFIVEWTTNTNTRIIGLACCRINIRHQFIAQIDTFEQLIEVAEFPNTSFISLLTCSMGTEDGREYTKLKPTQHEFFIGGSNLQVSA